MNIEMDSVFGRSNRSQSAGRAQRRRELTRMLNLERFADITLYPNIGSHLNDDNEQLQALEEYAQEWWRQGIMCFVERLYLASVTCMAFALETSIKHRLLSANVQFGKRADLKKCIGLCTSKEYSILSNSVQNQITAAAHRVLKTRDDIIHANIAFSKPETILYSEGGEHEITGDKGTIEFVEEFKTLAKETILDTKKVIDHLIATANDSSDSQVDIAIAQDSHQ